MSKDKKITDIIKSEDFSAMSDNVKDILIDDLKQETVKSSEKSKNIIFTIVGAFTIIVVVWLILHYTHGISAAIVIAIVMAVVIVVVVLITGSTKGLNFLSDIIDKISKLL